MTLPNMITLGRLALVPLILWLTRETAPPLALAFGALLFALAVGSDWLDGYLARRLRAFSRLGAFLDPIVDKILILGVLFVFVTRGVLPGWIFLLNLAREFLMTAVRHASSTSSEAVGANWMGKTKFCLQVAVCALLYLNALLDVGSQRLLVGSALAVTVVSYLFLIVFLVWHASEWLWRVDKVREGSP